MSAVFGFTIREAPSDVTPYRTLGVAGLPIEIDYSLAANAPLSLIDSFLSPAPLPGVGLWTAGNYSIGLMIAQALSLLFTGELWRTDLNGNKLVQIGETPETQGGTGQVSFSVSGQELDPNVDTSLSITDRLRIDLYAQNQDSINAHTLGIMASQSGILTPISVPDKSTNKFNPFRRNKFLGYYFRPGERPYAYFDKNGVDLAPGGMWHY